MGAGRSAVKGGDGGSLSGRRSYPGSARSLVQCTVSSVADNWNGRGPGDGRGMPARCWTGPLGSILLDNV